MWGSCSNFKKQKPRFVLFKLTNVHEYWAGDMIAIIQIQCFDAVHLLWRNTTVVGQGRPVSLVGFAINE